MLNGPPFSLCKSNLLDHSHAHSLTYCLWLLSCFFPTTPQLSGRDKDNVAQMPGIFFIRPFKKKLAIPCQDHFSSSMKHGQ